MKVVALWQFGLVRLCPCLWRESLRLLEVKRFNLWKSKLWSCLIGVCLVVWFIGVSSLLFTTFLANLDLRCKAYNMFIQLKNIVWNSYSFNTLVSFGVFNTCNHVFKKFSIMCLLEGCNVFVLFFKKKKLNVCSFDTLVSLDVFYISNNDVKKFLLCLWLHTKK